MRCASARSPRSPPGTSSLQEQSNELKSRSLSSPTSPAISAKARPTIRNRTSCSGSTFAAGSCSKRRCPTATIVVHDLPEMASALGVIDDGRQLLVTETGLYVRDVRTGALNAAHAARSRQSGDPLQRCPRPSLRRVLDRHDGQDEREGRRRDLLVLQGRAAQALSRRSASPIRSAFRPTARRPTTPTPP